MKMLLAIINYDDSQGVINKMMQSGFSVTKLATTGGFLKKGNCTLMIGTEAEKVDHAIELIKETCGKRQKITCNVPAPNISSISAGYMMMPMTVELGGATIFVTDVERFEKI